MSAARSVLLLVGSPRKSRSTSLSLGSYLLARLEGLGWQAHTLRIVAALREDGAPASLLAAVDGADLLVLATPLYIDSLPSETIRALECVAQRRPSGQSPKPQACVAMLNSGFPESSQCELALAICRRFAAQVGMRWAGGPALGAGPSIDGQPLERLGGAVRHVVAALDLTAAALDQGQDVPPEAQRLLARPALPYWLYRQVGDLLWYRLACKRKTLTRLRARPFERQKA
jgi:NAD(P)H-dependent FMN reductase